MLGLKVVSLCGNARALVIEGNESCLIGLKVVSLCGNARVIYPRVERLSELISFLGDLRVEAGLLVASGQSYLS